MEEKRAGPNSIEEFEARLLDLLYYLRDRFFGVTYEVSSTKTVRREKTNQVLVDAMCDFEKFCKTEKLELLKEEKVECYEFLKLALEEDAPFGSEYILGIKRDRSGITESQKHAIAVQSAAQVLWYLMQYSIPNITAMTTLLLNRKKPFFNLLNLRGFTPRTIMDWISPIFSVPTEFRKQQDSKNIEFMEILIQIPNIFTKDGVSFPRLRFAVINISKVLQVLNCTLEQTLNQLPITILSDQLKFYPALYVQNWVEEVYQSNSGISIP